MEIKVITICGSMRYSKEMMKIAEELELKEGYAVIQCVYNIDGQRYEGVDASILDKIHRRNRKTPSSTGVPTTQPSRFTTSILRKRERALMCWPGWEREDAGGYGRT